MLNKTLLSILFIFLIYKNSDAQYRVFVDTNAQWNINYGSYFDPYSHMKLFHFKGDTVIDQKHWSFLETSSDSNELIWERTQFLFREENKMVYRLYQNSERIIYNFNLNKNDTIEQLECPNIVADSLYTVFVYDTGSITLANQQKVKTYSINSYGFYHESGIYASCGSWIEGLGGDFAYLTDPDYYNGLICNAPWIDPGNNNLVCYKNNGQILYFNNQYNTCFYEFTVGTKENNLKDDLNFLIDNHSNQITINKSVSYKIIDLCGKMIEKGFGPLVSIESLSAGYYFLKTDTSTFKFVKQ